MNKHHFDKSEQINFNEIFLFCHRLTPDEYAIDEDCDKKARIQRAIEIAEGVEPPPGFISTKTLKSFHSMTTPNSQLVPNLVNSTDDTNGKNAGSKINVQQWHMLCSNPQTLRLLNDFHNMLQTTDEIPRIHSQVCKHLQFVCVIWTLDIYDVTLVYLFND